MISKKYRHIGYSFPGVSKGWKVIVEKSIVDIEREMWPGWIPLFVKRLIHYLATGNSVVRVKSRFWYKIRQKLTRGQIITDIKDKFAELRIYGNFGPEIESIIERAERECYETCEKCGSNERVKKFGRNWVYNLCKSCRYGRKK